MYDAQKFLKLFQMGLKAWCRRVEHPVTSHDEIEIDFAVEAGSDYQSETKSKIWQRHSGSWYH